MQGNLQNYVNLCSKADTDIDDYRDLLALIDLKATQDDPKLHSRTRATNRVKRSLLAPRTSSDLYNIRSLSLVSKARISSY